MGIEGQYVLSWRWHGLHGHVNTLRHAIDLRRHLNILLMWTARRLSLELLLHARLKSRCAGGVAEAASARHSLAVSWIELWRVVVRILWRILRKLARGCPR